MSESALLQLDDISFSYGKAISALNLLRLEIHEGESVALLGANGCGKSTLLKIMAGLLYPQKGRYAALGREITERTLQDGFFSMFFRKEVGILFQNSDAQLFNATVEEELAYGLAQLAYPAEEVKRRGVDLLERFRLGHLAARSPFALSGGEKKKVALASVLAVDPSVLLLDEPTAGLDPRSSRMLLDFIIEAKERTKTLVVATHDLHIVPEIASRVVVMAEDGRILGGGSPDQVLHDRELLRAANLVHIHRHLHDGSWHEHEHDHLETGHGHHHHDL